MPMRDNGDDESAVSFVWKSKRLFIVGFEYLVMTWNKGTPIKTIVPNFFISGVNECDNHELFIIPTDHAIAFFFPVLV